MFCKSRTVIILPITLCLLLLFGCAGNVLSERERAENNPVFTAALPGPEFNAGGIEFSLERAEAAVSFGQNKFRTVKVFLDFPQEEKSLKSDMFAAFDCDGKRYPSFLPDGLDRMSVYREEGKPGVLYFDLPSAYGLFVLEADINAEKATVRFDVAK